MSAHVALPTTAESTLPEGHSWRKIPPIAVIVGVIAVAVGYFLDGSEHHKQFWFSYLVAWLYAASLGLGALFFTMVQHVVRAGWSVLVRRTAENLAGALPLLALFFLPVLFLGGHDLYHHWMDAELVSQDAMLQAKSGYLNPGFWLGRGIFFLLVWGGLGWWFRRQSIKQDTMEGSLADREAHSRKLERRGAPAIALFAMTLTFAAIDWMMSLDPHWYSTMWGVYFWAGSFMASLALLGALHIMMQRVGLLNRIINDEHYHDLGKLTFAFTIFWTYIAFSQYFLIWYANIPEETSWFAHRAGNSWEWVGLALLVGHFIVPFFFLLPRTIKRIRGTLLIGCLWMLVMHFVDLHYMIMPAMHHHGVHFTLTDVLTWFGMVAVLMGVFVWNSKNAALIPIQDPRLKESVEFVNV